uniref:Endoplasmic reticulum-Golgi intermediate compartment protein 2 n=1 Tax=Schistosoma japonicum TaxID=6182 RepID=C1LEQ9_SCHJA|nr:Endoplasmic reticulum-Golgi intermediate compartment protein 2 [Schistosoma japonicum]
MEVRRRNVVITDTDSRPTITKLINELDVFPKLPKECKKSTWGGGLLTILTFCCISWLLVNEFRDYLDPPVKYSYEIDKDISGKIKVNIDIVVASPCHAISMDVVDTTGSPLFGEEKIEYISTVFDLSPPARVAFKKRQYVAGALREKHHAIQHWLWKYASDTNVFTNFNEPDTQVSGGRNPDACRIVGTLFVKKVEGNIHILLGKPLEGLGNLHLHVAPFLSKTNLNFSHRINHFSFGDLVNGQIHPLEAIESITAVASTSFQYFVTMVPTKVVNQFHVTETYQYAATVQNRTIDHASDSHGIPGIFFIYDTFPLVVKITYDRELLGTFFTRLAALAGGIFATIIYLREMLSNLPEILLRTRLGRHLDNAWTRRKHSLYNTLSEHLPNGLEKTGFITSPVETVLNPDSDT